MKIAAKKAMLVISFLPLAYMLLWAVIIAPGIGQVAQMAEDPAATGPSSGWFLRMLIVEAAGTLLILTLTIYFIVKVFRNPLLQGTTRFLWALGIFFGSPVMIPVYFFRYVWPDDDAMA